MNTEEETIIKLFAEDDLPEWCAREFINFGADSVRRLAQLSKEEINNVIENSSTKPQWKPLWIRSTIPDIVEQAKILCGPLSPPPLPLKTRGTKRKSLDGVAELPESRLVEIKTDLEGVVQRNWEPAMREIFLSNEYHIQHRDERVEFLCFCNRPLVLNQKKNRHDFNFSNVKRHFERYHNATNTIPITTNVIVSPKSPSPVHALLNAIHSSEEIVILEAKNGGESQTEEPQA